MGYQKKRNQTGRPAKKHDSDKVNEIFSFIGSSVKPASIFRIGTYKEFAEDGTSPAKPRPIKITMPDAATVEQIMSECTKFKDAPEHMSKYNVCFDMTKEERQTRKNLVEDAKKQTQNSPNWDFKVRGPPWLPEIKRFRKRAPKEDV